MTRAERGQQLWSILVLAARNRQILTYDIVSRACGVPAPSIGDFLRSIQQFCSEKGLAPLTSIIVNKQTGLPGDGFIAGEPHRWLSDIAPLSGRTVVPYLWTEFTNVTLTVRGSSGEFVYPIPTGFVPWANP